MKRLHVSVTVTDLEASLRFYESLFGTPPDVRKPDYAKWMLDDPCVNFAIDAQGESPGVDHLGIQVSDAAELETIAGRLAGAGGVARQEDATCCYARSDKAWVWDPQGVPWETFRTHGESTVYGEDVRVERPGDDGDDCCG